MFLLSCLVFLLIEFSFCYLFIYYHSFLPLVVFEWLLFFIYYLFLFIIPSLYLIFFSICLFLCFSFMSFSSSIIYFFLFIFARPSLFLFLLFVFVLILCRRIIIRRGRTPGGRIIYFLVFICLNSVFLSLFV